MSSSPMPSLLPVSSRSDELFQLSHFANDIYRDIAEIAKLIDTNPMLVDAEGFCDDRFASPTNPTVQELYACYRNQNASTSKTLYVSMFMPTKLPDFVSFVDDEDPRVGIAINHRIEALRRRVVIENFSLKWREVKAVLNNDYFPLLEILDEAIAIVPSGTMAMANHLYVRNIQVIRNDVQAAIARLEVLIPAIVRL